MTELDTGEIILRPETNNDREFLLKLYFTARESELRQVGWTSDQIQVFLTQQFQAQHYSYRQLYPRADFQIIEYRQDAIGRLYLDCGPDEFRLIDMALLPEFRNRRVGRFLIQGIQHRASQTEMPLSLHVEQSNAAFRLYKRMGFEVIEERAPYLFMRWTPLPGK